MSQTIKSVHVQLTFVALAIALGAATAHAAEFPAGERVELNGMAISGVYLQSVTMETTLASRQVEVTDIHLEADIHALASNQNGFNDGEWIPYLDIKYALTKTNGTWKTAGALDPMIASDGPHYGANVKLDGPGKYAVTYIISPPSASQFPRHTDKETGVGAWWEPFTYTGAFSYIGVGKKGGY